MEPSDDNDDHKQKPAASEIDWRAAEYDWRSLNWSKPAGTSLKNALRLRGMTCRKLPESRSKKADFLEEQVDKMEAWEQEWKGGARYPPEFMSMFELQEELAYYNYEEMPELDSETDERKLIKLREYVVKILIGEHNTDRDKANGDTTDTDDSKSVNSADEVSVDIEDRVFSHPEGIEGARHAGKSRHFFAHTMGSPTSKVDKIVRDQYGKLLAEHRFVNNADLQNLGSSFRLETDFNTILVQICFVLTGVMDGGSKGDFDMETLCLADRISLQGIDPNDWIQMTCMPTLEEAFEYAHFKMGKADLGDYFYTQILDPSFNLEEGIIPMMDLPRILDLEGRDLGRISASVSPGKFSPAPSPNPQKPNPTSPQDPNTQVNASFVNKKEQALEEACLQLQKDMYRCLKNPTEALLKKLSMQQVVISEDKDLITGKELPRGITDFEKLDSHSTSLMSCNEESVCGICLPCSKASYDNRNATDPSFDPDNHDHVQETLIYGDDPDSTCCKRCPGFGGVGQPLHPNLWLPQSCQSCGTSIMCNGEIQMCCTKCKFSFIMPAPEKERKTVSYVVSSDLTAATGYSGALAPGPLASPLGVVIIY